MLKIMPRCDTVTKSMRLPAQLTKELEQLARENHSTFTSVVIQCLQYALDNIDSSDDSHE